jgi:serine-type D-Ala-D-Ala carboxypeptidase (penicillin-binding protein 5/6)
VAERLCGSVQICVQSMNRRAQQLGMTATRYQTVNGMPPGQGTQPDMSSAADMVTLTRALLKHSHVLAWTALERAPFNNGRTMLANTNRLVGKIAGVDGLKTGFTRKARFNLVTTAERGSLRLIAIVLGAHNSTARFQTATTLLEWGFANFTRMRLIKSGDPLGIEVPVQDGDIAKLRPIVAADTSLLVRKSEVENLQLSFRLPPVVPAPIARHEILGELVVRDSEGILAVILVVSPHEVMRVQWPPAQ